MRTQEVFLRIEDAEDIESTLHTHEGNLASRLNRRYAPAGDGAKRHEPAPCGLDYAEHLRHLGGDLAAAREGLAAAEDAHMRNVVRLVELRRRRQELKVALGRTFQKVRHTLESLYGSERGFELVLVSGETPRTASRLAQQVGQAVELLRHPPVELPPLELKGAKVDRALLAEDLEPGLGELQAVLKELKRMRKEARHSREVKAEAVAAFDRTFRSTAGILEGLFRLVELDEIADRVRPKGRPGRPSADRQTAEASSGEEGAEAAPADAPAEPGSAADPAGGPASGEPASS